MPSSAVQTCALRSEEHTSELQSHSHLVCRLLLAKSIEAVVVAGRDTVEVVRGLTARVGGLAAAVRVEALLLAGHDMVEIIVARLIFFLKVVGDHKNAPSPPPGPLRR